MSETESQLLTAGDLMSRDVETISANLPLRDAAAQLVRREIHGAPVVDEAGRCIGVLSVSDLARWASSQGKSKPQLARACSFQEKHRAPGGRETITCRLAEGVCPLQRLRELPDGKVVLECIEPHSVPLDWQMVELESLPGNTVRDFMTTAIVTADPAATVPELARLMLDRQVHRLIVLDVGCRPVGVVTVNDILQVVAHPEIVNPVDSQ